MSKYEIFIKMLHDKGCVKSMQMAKNLAPEPPYELPDSLKEAINKKCVSSSISTSMRIDPELKRAFDDAACEMIFNKVYKDLDLKKDVNFKPTEKDLFAKSMAEAIATMMFNNN
ncbi:MAG: hypothetical protein PHR06_01215 [Candidatus Cloacimonetes bacterium]|nr:hypothetical protein [Candidatus Cloacimonadota bacterium]